ncbi:MAG: T9SS type A sorting domain-containing protein, partial [Cytophagales bacterium]
VDYLFGKNAWGLCFIANKNHLPAVQTSYATIYKLQTDKFPYGEIAAGPAPATDHAAQTPYFSPAHNANLWHKDFNTSRYTFFEQSGDYVCMETIITQLADAFFLLTQATKTFCDTPLSIQNNEKKSLIENGEEIIWVGNSLIFNSNSPKQVQVFDLSGRKVFEAANTTKTIEFPSSLKGFFVLNFKDEGNAMIKTMKIVLH